MHFIKTITMAFINTLDGWDELEEQFAKAGYTFTLELSNQPVIELNGEWVDYDDLSPELQKAMDDFAEKHSLEN